MPHVTGLVLRYVAAKIARHEYNVRTAKSARWVLLNFAAVCPADPAMLRRRHVDRWLASQNVASTTVLTRLSVVRNFCRWLVVEGHTTTDATLGLTGPKRPRHQPRAIAAPQVAATLRACPDARARLIVSLMVQEGLRRAEVVALQVADVDMARRTMLVSGKGDAERFLPITDATHSALAAYLAEHPSPAGPLVRSYQYPHRPISPDHVGRIVSEWMSDAGVKRRARDGVSAHALRHTAASDVLEHGAHITQVQAMLGHESLETTRKYLRRVDAAGLLGVMNGRDYRAAGPEPPVA